jgi:hypothetical protein
MAVAYGALYGGLIVAASRGLADARLRREFVNLIHTDEKELVNALASNQGDLGRDVMSDLVRRAEVLEGKAQDIAERASANPDFQTIVADYARAAESWRSALALIRDNGEVDQSAQDKLSDALRLRKEAVTEYDKKFALPSPERR